MKYLKHFESGNASFDWLRKQKNEAYFELIEILQNELLDDYNVVSRTDEDFNEDNPEHSFWVFRLKEKVGLGFAGNESYWVTKENEVGNSEINAIIIFNILHKIKKEFEQELQSLIKRAENHLEREITIESEVIGDPNPIDPETDYWDFIIKIGKRI